MHETKKRDIKYETIRVIAMFFVIFCSSIGQI